MSEIINTVIIGAGKAGILLIKELKNPRHQKYNLIGLIDDDINKHNKEIMGFRVLGNTASIPQLAKKHQIKLFIIAIPSASGETIRRIVDLIKKTSADFMIVPPIFQNLKINTIAYPRKVSVEDLLRKPTINVLTEESLQKLRSATILITGVAGSIGSSICYQLASCNQRKIIGIDCAETPLFYLSNQMSERYPSIDFEPILCNIQEKEDLVKIFTTFKPDIVYHCAAYKHVELMQKFPHECVKNNLQGTINVINAALDTKVKRFVFISTDKAVNPTSVMGASKRIIEKYILSLKSSSTKFMIVRFGNVLESNGSAIPLFKKQIEKGGPVTITDPRMERYFMTLEEAAQLVIQASIIGKGGELFVLEMGKPYKITDIVYRLIELYGYKKEEIPIKFIGIRPGEKLTEELFYKYEEPYPSKNQRILICDLSRYNVTTEFRTKIQDLIKKSKDMSKDELKELLLKIANDD